MKKKYVKPDVEIVDFDINDFIMDVVVNPDWSIGDDFEEGLE